MIYKQEVLLYHQLSIEKYGGAVGIRDEGMLSSAIERPFASYGGADLYVTPFEKAAAILESIIKNHPFVDGNKRTGLIACGALLLRNGYELIATEKDAYDFVIKIASSHLEFEKIVSFIEANTNQI
jgi:death-on-curing protein